MNRRELIKAGAAAALLSPLAAPSPAANRLAGSLYKYVYDQRFAASRRCARDMAMAGVTTAAIRDDVTDLWSEDLAVHWRTTPQPLAGMTTGGALVCLDQMGRGARMRVLLHARHVPDHSRLLRHEIRGAAALVTELSWRLRYAPEHWPSAVASCLRSADTTAHAGDFVRQTVMTASGAEPLGEPLESWLMSPLPRAVSEGVRA